MTKTNGTFWRWIEDIFNCSIFWISISGCRMDQCYCSPELWLVSWVIDKGTIGDNVGHILSDHHRYCFGNVMESNKTSVTSKLMLCFVKNIELRYQLYPVGKFRGTIHWNYIEFWLQKVKEKSIFQPWTSFNQLPIKSSHQKSPKRRITQSISLLKLSPNGSINNPCWVLLNNLKSKQQKSCHHDN